MRIFHVALRSEWEAARAGRYYDRSTLGLSLAEVGFVHCSRADQWQRVRDVVYAGVTEPLVLLTIDTDRLDAPLVEEPAEPGGTETFPHVYGAIPVVAVVDVTAVAAPRAEGVQGAPTQRSFSSLLMAEIGIRIALAVAVMLASAVAGTVVDATVGQPAGLVAALVVLGLGTVVAIAVYRRWDRRTSV